jgi:multicomponent Na+:H+ antiporter subunit G
MTLLIDALLVVMVLMAWLGCVGFARLRAPLDRMHCVAFVNVTAGSALVLAAFLNDGASVRAWKILLIAATSLLAGAAMSHATGRMIMVRDSVAEGTADLPPEDTVPEDTV